MLPVLFHVGNFNFGPLHVGDFPVHSWGLLLMAGFLLAVWRTANNGWRYNISRDDIWEISILGLLGGVIGGRLAFVGLNAGYFWAHPAQILALWEGGMTFYGGMGGGLLAGVLACRAKKVVVGNMGDLAALAFPIGYALGRVGCLLNGCCYGGACDLPWAVRYHEPNGTLSIPSHPVPIYSAIISVGIYCLLLPIEKNRTFKGQVLWAYITMYAVYRFFIEFFREGVTADVTSIAHLTQGQVASILLALFSAAIYLTLQQNAARRQTGQQAAA